jgi:hypothetical protein
MMAEFSDTFGARVEQILKEKGLSPYEVMRRAEGEISHQTVRNMVRGQIPSPSLVVRFALAVGVHPNDLLELTGWGLRYVGDGGGEESAGDNGCLAYQTFVGRLAGAC